LDFQRYLDILDRRKWVIVVTTITTVIVVALGTYSAQPMYRASALVRIAEVSSEDRYVNVSYSERVIQTYVHLLTSRPFLDQVIDQLSLPLSASTLAGMIGIEPLSNTELIQISVESPSPQQAMAVANALATLLVAEGQKLYVGPGKSARQILEEQVAIQDAQLREDRAELAAIVATPPNSEQVSSDTTAEELTAKIRIEEATYASLLSQYEKARLDETVRANSVSIVEPAVEPSSSSKPRVVVNLALGFLVGLMGGAALALVLEAFDPAIHSGDELEGRTGIPLLGRIPRFTNAQSTAARGDALRVLCNNMLSLAQNYQMKTLMVTSAEPGVGKSTLVTFMALAIAQTGRRVIVVDADLRNPRLHSLLGISRELGLSDVLADPTQLGAALKETRINGVRALTAGASRGSPVQLFYLPSLPKVMQSITEQADVVLWDSPPILAAADAAVLGPAVDGVLLVTARDQTTFRQLDLAVKQLKQVGSSVLGLVYNRAKAGNGDYLYYYQHAHEGERAGKPRI
jgi:capsular exopolysaccharide synthesis family protein